MCGRNTVVAVSWMLGHRRTELEPPNELRFGRSLKRSNSFCVPSQLPTSSHFSPSLRLPGELAVATRTSVPHGAPQDHQLTVLLKPLFPQASRPGPVPAPWSPTRARPPAERPPARRRPARWRRRAHGPWALTWRCGDRRVLVSHVLVSHES